MSLVQEDSVTGEAPVSAVRRPAHKVALRRASREILLVLVLFLAYKVGRLAADGHVGTALANAQHVWQFERALYLPSEYAVQQAMLAHEWLIRAANCYYAYVHFPATAACLIWLYFRRPDRYSATRRMIAWLTACALVVHVVVPLAPPRMLTAIGMVDTGRLFGPAVYGSPAIDRLANQYAAMPSLHVGWALAIAVALIGAGRGWWRWLWLAHPAITMVVVVVTGHHYWLDAIVVTVLLVLVLAVQTGGVAAALRPAQARVPRPRVSEG